MDLREATEVARGLMDAYELFDWKFELDGGRHRYGCCKHQKKTLSMSRAWVEVNSLKAIEDVMLHEIAHALCGPNAAHGPEWQRKAIELGVRPSACAVGTVAPPPLLVGKCPRCDRRFPRQKANVPRRALGCSACRHATGAFHELKWYRPVTS